VWITTLALVAVVGLLHGAGYLLAARLLGHDVRRPWIHVLPGWGAFRCSRDDVRRWWTRPVVHVCGTLASYLGIVTLAFVGIVTFGVENHQGRWEVGQVVAGSAADGILRPGDVITTLNKTVVTAPHQPITGVVAPRSLST
jgi:hypothetical protein